MNYYVALRRRTYTLLTILMISFFVFTVNESVATTQKPRIPKPVCRIEVGDAHLSTSIKRHRGIRVVKVNATSICNIRQEQVTLTLNIYKVGLLSDHLMLPVETNPLSPKSAGLVVKIQNAYVVCENTTLSSYYGIAFAKAFIQGKWQYAGKTRSVHTREFKCGT